MIQQIYLFLGISGIGWILDFTTFTILGLLLSNLFIVSNVSALIGASFVFSLSPKFIFNNKKTLPLILKYFSIFVSSNSDFITFFLNCWGWWVAENFSCSVFTFYKWILLYTFKNTHYPYCIDMQLLCYEIHYWETVNYSYNSSLTQKRTLSA